MLRRSSDRLAVLRLPNYRRYWLGGAIAASGAQMTGVAAGWELYNRTHQPISLGMLGLVSALPVILLALPAGTVADRHSRKSVVLWAQMAAALCLILLFFVSRSQLPLAWFYLLILLLATSGAFFGPALLALVANIVGDDLLPDATKWSSIRWQLASTLGPIIGSFLIFHFGSPSPIYVIDAAGRLIFCVLFAGMKPKPHQRSAEKLDWKEVVAGWQFVRSNPLILSTITLDMVAVLFGGATAMLPIYARDILHVGAQGLGPHVGVQGLGPLRAAPAIGAIFMSLFLTVCPPMKRAGYTLLWAVAGFGVATIVFGLSHIYWLSLLSLVFLGALDNISVVIRTTLLQLLTPDAMRGRVNAVNSVFVGTSNEIGELESGVAAQLGSTLFGPAVGPLIAVSGGGAVTILVVLFVAFRWPVVRGLKHLEELRPIASGVMNRN